MRPGLVLRLEALCVLLSALWLYAFLLHGTWWLFLVLLLAPDLSLLGYAFRGHKAVAAMVYNLAHSYVLPAGLFFVPSISGTNRQVAAIWISHIALDRVLGFGLKYREAFKPTHMQSADVFAGGE